MLGARDLRDARRRAQAILRGRPPCRCCASPSAHVFDRVGSTLFLDDDPAKLAQAFDPDERDEDTVTILAAAIVTYGRPRVSPWEDAELHRKPVAT